MKLWKKLYLLIMILYMLVSIIVGLIVTEKSYSSSVNDEIYSCIKDIRRFSQNSGEENDDIGFISNRELSQRTLNNIFIRCKQTSKFLADSESYYEVRNVSTKEIFKTYSNNWNQDEWGFLKYVPNGSLKGNTRQDLYGASKGTRTYILKTINKEHYIFMSGAMDIDHKIIVTIIRNITKVDQQRNQQMFFLIRLEMVGLIVILIFTPLLSRYVTKPIEQLKITTAEIASGSYNKRVDIKSKDEIGQLGIQFNKMAEEIESKIAEFESEGERKQRFVDNLIHDLRTPLTSVIGYADFLKSTKYDEEVFYKGLNNIQSEGKRMLKMINRLMNMIILTNENIIINDVKVDKLFRDVYSVMEIKLNNKNISLLIENTNLIIPMNYDLMKEVIINLIDNAYNASNEGSVIILGAKIDRRKKYIYVKDQGRGMAENEIEKITEPFYRIDKARSRKDGGAGLGLSITNAIVKGHGAQLKFISEVGKGTEVRIIF